MGKLLDLFELVVSRLPSRSRATLTRRFLARANAEREARRFATAAVLYEEALRLSPRNARAHVQYGHMHKEAGDLDSAEASYRQAHALMPDDPDLALQMGHFYKVADRPQEAETAYRRATKLRPGWIEAETELRRFSSASSPNVMDARDTGAPAVPELLPLGEPQAPPVLREGFHVTRLGANRARMRNGFRRVLRGVEAIRGFVIAPTPLTEVSLVVDGAIVAREPLRPYPLAGGGEQTRYVFNLWHDFSDLRTGEAQIELRVTNGRGWSRVHRATLHIVEPHQEELAEGSDAIVPSPHVPQDRLEEAIRSRPSRVRPAQRSALLAAPRSILVQRADQLGDLACSIPALARLRELFPQARIIALLTAANVALGRELPMIDGVEIATFDGESSDGGKVMTAPVQAELRGRLAAYRFDLAIDLAETAESRPLLLLSGAPFLYGFKIRDYPWLTAGFELATHDPGNYHEMTATSRKLVGMIDGLAAMADSDPYILPRTAPADASRTSGLVPSTPYVVLHLGARLAFSRWPGFVALAEFLLQRTPLTVVLMGDDMPPGLRQDERVRAIVGPLDFDAFDSLLAGAVAFVGNDSGPKHLASLRGTPVVSLHMARLNWNEWGQTATGAIVSRQVPCAGCGIGGDGEECGKEFACIRDIAAQEVFDALSRFL